MKPEQFKLLLDKYTESILNALNTVKNPKTVIRTQLKEFTCAALEAAVSQVEMYGQNTHTYAAVKAFEIEFKRIV